MISRIVCFFIFVTLFSGCIKDRDKCIMEGRFFTKEFHGKKIYMYKFDYDYQLLLIDSTRIKKMRFVFEEENAINKEPELRILFIGSKNKDRVENCSPIFISEAGKIKLNVGSNLNWQVKGSELNNKWEKYRRKKYQLECEFNNYQQKLSELDSSYEPLLLLDLIVYGHEDPKFEKIRKDLSKNACELFNSLPGIRLKSDFRSMLCSDMVMEEIIKIEDGYPEIKNRADRFLEKRKYQSN